MTLHELNRRIFKREHTGKQVLWQPRIDHWYHTHKREGTLPERYRDMTLLEVFDDLGCSPRTYDQFNRCIRMDDDERVSQEKPTEGDREITVTHTPVGDLTTIRQRAEKSHHTVKYPVVTPEDMKVQEWLLRHRRVWFDHERYEEGCRNVGDRAAPSIFIARINILRIVIQYMGFENGLIALYDNPAPMESLIRTINETDNALLDVVCDCPIEIINFGDNVHQALCPPPVFEQWVQPEYLRRNERLHAAGKATYPHWDGDCAQLLPYARDCGFDGYEAITPLPQGDVTLEQVRDALGDDQILIDGVPCTDFLPSEPIESLRSNVRKCIEYFHPYLVLGISDEISPVGDIERVRLVSEICAEYDAA